MVKVETLLISKKIYATFSSNCGEVGFVSRVHLLLGEVRSVTTALKVVEEVQEEVQEIEDEW